MQTECTHAAFRTGRFLPAARTAHAGLDALARAAEGGCAASQYAPGLRLLDGRGVDRDPGLAARWLGRAAEANCAGAAYMMGVLRLAGLGVVRDLEDSRRWFARAHVLGHPDGADGLMLVDRWLGVGGRASRATH